MQSLAMLLARILLSLVFLISPYRQFVNRARVEQEMGAHGIPAARFLLACAIAVEILGGLSLLLGLAARWGALALAVLTLVSTWIYYRDIADREQQLHLLKNLAIVGGLLMVACFGSGAISLDAW